MKKTMSRQGSMKQKWVPKGDGEKDGEENDENEYEVNTKADGPFYDRRSLLQTYALYKSHKGQLQATASTKFNAEEISMGLKERPAEEDGRVQGARRALREQVKAQKMAKRLSSESLGDADDDEREAPMGATYSEADMQKMYGAMHPAMWQYLQNMAYAPQMYGFGHTTVMLRNIPNHYTRDMLLDRLNKGYEGQFDFVYLPIDFNSKCNVGYAFINFRQPAVAAAFINEFHGAKASSCLPGFSSAKVCEVSYARVQGRDANMDNLRDEKFIEKLTEKPEWQPLFLDEKNKEIPFTNTLGAAGGKKRASRGSASATPTGAVGPSGFMMPPYGPMMYPPYAPMMAPPAPPPTTLAGVLPSATTTTMLMLKNIPATFSRSQLIEALNKSYKGCYDFLFLPGDSKTEGNRGFCFINFRKADKAKQFTSEYNQKKMSEAFGVEDADDKVCEIQQSRLDAIERSIERLQSPAPTKDGKGGNAAGKSAWFPLLFDNKGSPLPFPLLAVPTPGAASPTAGAKGTAATPSASSKGKGKGKGKDQAAAAAAAMGFPGYPYPGYYGGYAYAAYAMQHAHAHAAAQAAAFAGQGMPPPHAATAKAPGSRPSKPLNDDLKAALTKQIEFYFSADNLCKDLYLRSHMEGDGWVLLSLISQFNQVRKYRASLEGIAEALVSSSLLEVDAASERVRLKDKEDREKWAKSSSELTTHIEAMSPKVATSS